jgi:hypothetical protein
MCFTYDKTANLPKNVSYKIPYRTHELVKSMAVNYREMIDEYRNYPVNENRNSLYAIITTAAIVSNATRLNAFIESKKKRGFAVETITESVWGGTADKLRSWLQANYQSKEMEYVLLIGNPDPGAGDVPMKMTYPNRDVPTDFYYADLSGTWDKNGNGKFGELSDIGPDGIDHVAEVGVGRIPVYSGGYQTLDKILDKTVSYESAKSTEIGWRRKMLLCMKGYNTPAEGSAVGEAIKKAVSAATNQWSYYRIYDNAEGNPELIGVSENFVLLALSQNSFGLVEWMTHGSATDAMYTMSSNATAQWDDKHPSIVLCGSCLNAQPSVSNNLAYSLLKNGAICAVGGTQTTIFSTGSDIEKTAYNSGFIYQFGKNIAIGKMQASDAVDRIRAVNTPASDWQNYLSFNLYGDPAIGIETNADNTENSNPVPVKENNTTLSCAVFRHSQNMVIQYHLPLSGTVSVELFDTKGKRIAPLVRSFQKQGNYSWRCDMKKYCSGYYYVRLSVDNAYILKKLVFIK